MSETAPGTIYRQDEFVRRPTAWTRPMMTAVAGYFVAAQLASLAVSFAYHAQISRVTEAAIRTSIGQQGRTATDALVNKQMDIANTVGFGASIFVLVVFIGLAVLTMNKPRTWVFWVDFAFLVLGILFALTALIGVVVPAGPTTMPTLVSLQSVISGLVAAVILGWMILGLVRYGPWAQEKAPATLQV